MSRKPRELADLSFAEYLVDFPGDELRYDDSLSTVHIAGKRFTDPAAGGIHFTEAVFTGVGFDGGTLRRSRFNDAWLHGSTFVGTELAESVWLNSELVNTALAGVECYEGLFNRVAFFDCKLEAVNLRAARLRDVMFVDCVLRDVDFNGAELTRVSFPGSTLADIRFDKARMAKVDLRSTRELVIRNGYDSLRGATITYAQSLELAPHFARFLGVTIADN